MLLDASASSLLLHGAVFYPQNSTTMLELYKVLNMFEFPVVTDPSPFPNLPLSTISCFHLLNAVYECYGKLRERAVDKFILGDHLNNNFRLSSKVYVRVSETWWGHSPSPRYLEWTSAFIKHLWWTMPSCFHLVFIFTIPLSSPSRFLFIASSSRALTSFLLNLSHIAVSCKEISHPFG